MAGADLKDPIGCPNSTTGLSALGSFHYYPRREGYGRPPQVANGDHETDPALLHLVCYVSALEALFDQITIDLIAARGKLVRRAPARKENEPNTDNPVVLFG